MTVRSGTILELLRAEGGSWVRTKQLLLIVILVHVLREGSMEATEAMGAVAGLVGKAAGGKVEAVAFTA